MSSTVEKIKENLSIVDIVDSYVKLEKAGSAFKARCPFHHEKSPSFFVSPARGSYYCFGCGAKGDMFSFIQEFEGVDFLGALKILADRAGVSIETNSRDEGEKKKEVRLYSLLERASLFFQEFLEGSDESKKYLLDRGLNEKTIALFRIGYAPNEWRHLKDLLNKEGFKDDELLDAGLIKKHESGKVYDVFRGRIMFPIADSAGRVVGFSGRILDPSIPGGNAKYLNSPETVLFQKSHILYGFDKAKNHIRKVDFAILVEGQLDLLMAHQAGYTNTVATSGTALSINHLEKIRRLTNKIVFAYDGDNAGLSALLRGARLALSLGMDVKAAAFEIDDDPAEVIKRDPEEWKRIIKESQHHITVRLNRLVHEEKKVDRLFDKTKKEILPDIALIDDPLSRSRFIREVSKVIDVSEQSVEEYVIELRKKGIEDLKKDFDKVERHGVEDGSSENSVRVSEKNILEHLISILSWQKEIPDPSIEVDSYIEKLTTIMGSREAVEATFNMDNSEKQARILEAEIAYNETKKLEEIVAEMVNHLELDVVKRELLASLRELKEAERSKDTEAAHVLLLRCKELSKRIEHVSMLSRK